MSNKQPCFAQTVMIIAASLTIHPQGLQQNNRHRKAPQDNWTASQSHWEDLVGSGIKRLSKWLVIHFPSRQLFTSTAN